ncbi:MAG: PQQ-binding-like beta-propeller repeat protein [Ignavibacteria bacterium]|nr:PQQ-binding-like beta-propeller repeat protein [Ignavibacteria bacterium]
MIKYLKHIYLFIFILLIILIFESCNYVKLNIHYLELSENDWIIPGGSNQRDNISKSILNISDNPTLQWYYNSDAGYPKYPLTIANNIIFSANLEGYITLSDINTGSRIGSFSVPAKSITSAPIIINNSIIFTTNGYKENFVGRYNLIEGKYKWQRQIPRCETLMIAESDYIIIATVNGDLLKINSENGDMIWNAKTQNSSEIFSAFYSSPALLKGSIFIGNDNGNIYKIDVNTGKIVKKLELESMINSDISIYNDKIFFSANNNNFYCCNETLSIIWERNLNSKTINSNCFDIDKLYIAAINGYIYCLNQSNGNEIWKYKTGGTITGSPIIHNEKIFIGSFDKNIYCLNKNNGNLLWKYQLDGRIRGGLVIWKNYLIVTSDDKNIYCFK